MKARPLIVIGEKWWWLASAGLHLILWSPRGKKTRTLISKVLGRSHEEIERGQHKRTSDGMLKPEQVREYILLNQTDLL